MKYPMIKADETGETMFGVREIPDQETAFGPPPNPTGGVRRNEGAAGGGLTTLQIRLLVQDPGRAGGGDRFIRPDRTIPAPCNFRIQSYVLGIYPLWIQLPWIGCHDASHICAVPHPPHPGRGKTPRLRDHAGDSAPNGWRHGNRAGNPVPIH